MSDDVKPFATMDEFNAATSAVLVDVARYQIVVPLGIWSRIVVTLRAGREDRERLEIARVALAAIAEGRGRFSRDNYEFASNVIEEAKRTASEALVSIVDTSPAGGETQTAPDATRWCSECERNHTVADDCQLRDGQRRDDGGTTMTEIVKSLPVRFYRKNGVDMVELACGHDRAVGPREQKELQTAAGVSCDLCTVSRSGRDSKGGTE